MNPPDFYRRFELDDSIVRETGFNPYYCSMQSGLSDPVRIEGRDFVDLASNNYLGLAADSRVTSAITEAVEQYGASMCGTPIATGCHELYRSLERKLAAFLGLEDAVILPSAYQANNAVFGVVAGKEDVIFIDHFAHSSLVQGARAAGCRIRPFLHNDPDHLRSILGKLKDARQAFVVTESVFSTEGSIAPFREIIDICIEYRAIPVVDDSHGIGVIGSRGHGVLDHFDIGGFTGIYTASLGKALANAGGVIAGRKVLIDHLRYYCPHLIYSTAVTPGTLAGVDAVLGIVESEFARIGARMRENRHRIRHALISAGFAVIPGDAPINAIEAGTSVHTIRLAKAFFAERILTTPFIHPSVPPDDGRLRLIAGAHLCEESLHTVQEAIPRIARQCFADAG